MLYTVLLEHTTTCFNVCLHESMNILLNKSLSIVLILLPVKDYAQKYKQLSSTFDWQEPNYLAKSLKYGIYPY